jgi:hypothetical protein
MDRSAGAIVIGVIPFKQHIDVFRAIGSEQSQFACDIHCGDQFARSMDRFGFITHYRRINLD